MSDALCGPSNALQNLQKHSSVDRTLQQDRLVGRHSLSQGFRSTTGANAGALDSEFEAFQAGLAGPAQLQADVLHPLPHLAHAQQPPPPHFAHVPAGPDWAADFQRLDLSNNHAPGVQQHPAPAGPASWHQEFMKHTPVAPQQQQYGAGSISGYGVGRFGGSAFQQPMGFGNMSGGLASQVAQGGQNAQTSAQQLDAAFEQAFAQLDQDLAVGAKTAGQSSNTHQRTDSRDFRREQYAVLREVTMSSEQVIKETSRVKTKAKVLEDAYRLTCEEELEQEMRDHPHIGPNMSTRSGRLQQYGRGQNVLSAFEEQRPALYVTYNLWSAIALGLPDAALIFLEALEKMEERGILLAGELETHTIARMINYILSGLPPQEVCTRGVRLMQAINERRMSSYPLFFSNFNSLRADPLLDELSHIDLWLDFQKELVTLQASAPPSQGPHPDSASLDQQPQEQNEATSPLPQQHDDDEMAHTAGQLLERVADNTSEKFQNSQFLQLMRKLRDREVKVEGDKMVEVSNSTPSLSSQLPASSSAPQQHTPAPSSSAIPDIDPTILSHADTDFALPVFPDDAHPAAEYASASESPEPRTDEITGQYRHYNAHAAYHRR